MPSFEFSFTAISKVTMVYHDGANHSTVKFSDVRLEVSKGLKKSEYIDSEGLPTKQALKPIATALIHGLITNMRHGAEKGWWKEGEHMQYVIDHLQKAFVEPDAGLSVSTM